MNEYPNQPIMDSHELLSFLIEDLVNLQVAISQDFPSRYVPEYCKKYNNTRNKINELINDPNFSQKTHPADCVDPLWVVIIYLVIVFVFLIFFSALANSMRVQFLYIIFSVISYLILILGGTGFFIAIVIYKSDPNNMAYFYTNNSNLPKLIKELFEYAYIKLKNLHITGNIRIDTKRTERENYLLENMNRALSYGSNETLFKELYKLFPELSEKAGILDERKKLEIYKKEIKKNLYRKLDQKAKYGIDVPTDIENEIDLWNEWITKIDEQLQKEI
jgi:hypothetical protein